MILGDVRKMFFECEIRVSDYQLLSFLSVALIFPQYVGLMTFMGVLVRTIK